MYNTTIKAAVEAHRVKPLSFDLIFSAIVLAFLAGLYSYLNVRIHSVILAQTHRVRGS
jgi:hypothetical protein